jgi:ABC-type taurine transport system substrate-binding protein
MEPPGVLRLTGYEYRGGVCSCSPKVASWGPNRLDIFVTGTDSALYHKWFDGAAWGPSLTDYEYMGGVIQGEPKVVSWGPSRLDVFVTGTDSALYHKRFDGAGWAPSLTGYEYMDGIVIEAGRIQTQAATAS